MNSEVLKGLFIASAAVVAAGVGIVTYRKRVRESRRLWDVRAENLRAEFELSEDDKDWLNTQDVSRLSASALRPEQAARVQRIVASKDAHILELENVCSNLVRENTRIKAEFSKYRRNASRR
jgi:hypothetical protein